MGTKIDDLMKDMSGNKLNQDESSMVDSIINDINGDLKQNPQTSQQQMPQLTDEERQMLMQQQQQEQMMQQKMYEQQMMQQQQQQQQMMQQQMMQQQMMQQQQQQQQQMEQTSLKEVNEPFDILSKLKEPLVVFLIVLFFNLNVVNNLMTIKGNSIFYNIQEGEPTFIMILIKSLVVASIFFAIQSIIQ